MNWYLIFYLFSISDNLSGILLGFGVLSTIGAIIAIIAYFGGFAPYDGAYRESFVNSKDEEIRNKALKTKNMRSKWMKISLRWLVFLWLSFVLLPSREDMLLIIAGGSVGEFIQSDDNAKEIPADVTRFLRKEILEATMEEGNEHLKESLGIEDEKKKLMKKSKEELVKMLEEAKKQQDI